VEKTKMVMAAHVASVRAAIAAGVKVAMGTDSGVTPHGQNLRELALMVECGMTPIHALVATTRTATQLLGIADHTGTLEAGKVADVVVLAGEALDLDDLAGRVRGVYQAGALVSRGRPAG
jgi:imidazolonepropionase-like amidohydrolase